MNNRWVCVIPWVNVMMYYWWCLYEIYAMSHAMLNSGVKPPGEAWTANCWQSIQIAITPKLGARPNWSIWFQRKIEGLMSPRITLSFRRKFRLPHRARTSQPTGRTRKSHVICSEYQIPKTAIELIPSFMQACKVKLTGHCGWNLCGSQYLIVVSFVPNAQWHLKAVEGFPDDP